MQNNAHTTPATPTPAMTRLIQVAVMTSPGSVIPDRDHFYGHDAARYARTVWTYRYKGLYQGDEIDISMFDVRLPSNATQAELDGVLADLKVDDDCLAIWTADGLHFRRTYSDDAE